MTQATRGWLKKVLALGPAPWQAGTILLSCGPQDLHTVGLDAMEVLLAQRGWECHMLGDHTPTLTAAIRRTQAAATIVTSHLSTNRGATAIALRAANRCTTRLFYAGNAFLTPAARHGLPGTYLGEDLVDAATIVADAIQRPLPVRAPG